MAGHSKWNNIKRRKGAEDAKRAKIFTKVGREIQVAVKDGGTDPEFNPRLAAAIVRAKAANVPNDNIERSIKRGSGADGDIHFDEITYEGYGPGGVAVVVQSLTDNRNRTAGEIRHLFDRNGGNLGTTGSVTFMFETIGTFFVEAGAFDEEDLMMIALDAGADDIARVESEEEQAIFEINCQAKDFHKVETALKENGVTIVESSLEPTPENYVRVEDEEAAKKVEKLIEDLEDSDDVQNVYTNYEPVEVLSS